MTTNTNAATWTDKQYLEQLALHYQNNPVPEIRAHHERLMKIASTLSTAAAQPPETCDALGKRLIGEMLEADAIATVVCRQVAELPDRSSPEDWPEAMLVTHEELDSIVFEAVNAAQSSPQPAQAWPIAPDVAADLERSDWTPEEALRWYAAGKHYDTVPNGDGTSSARILDTGEVASNALRAYEQPPSTGVEPGRLLAEHVLGMDFVTDRGLRARELARKVLAQHTTAAPQPAVQQEPVAIVTRFHDLGGEIDWAKARVIAPVGAKLYLAAPVAQGDADFEAVRKKLCALQRYSFVLDDDGVVRRVQDRTGNWIEFDDAHGLFDPVAVDAAIAAQAKEGA